MSSNDYYEYITRLVRTPSAVTTDVPRYGNAPMFFRNSRMMNVNSSCKKEDTKENVDQNNISRVKKKQHQSPHFRENVEVFEYEQSGGADDDHDGNYVTNGSSANSNQVCDDVNADANRFIQQRRQGFQLCKWKNFKDY